MPKIELIPRIVLGKLDTISVTLHDNGTVALHDGWCLEMTKDKALELAETILNKLKEAPA